MKKIRNILFSLIFIFGSLYVFYRVPLRINNQREYSTLEGRPYTKFYLPTISNVYGGFYQDNFEEAFADQMVGRNYFLTVYKKYERVLNYISSRNHKPYTMYQIGTNVYRSDITGDYLFEFPVTGKDNDVDRIKSFADSVNAVADYFDDVHFYVYKPFRLSEVDWFDEDNFITTYGVRDRIALGELLHEDIIYEAYYPDSIEQYQEHYYKTDPHWNDIGADYGYKSIVAMFRNYYDIEPLEPKREYCYVDFDYYGQYGREALYLAEPDTYCDLEYDESPFITFVNGVETQYDMRNAYKEGTADEIMWQNIYSNYHGNDEREVEFVYPENNYGRNILVFVDSYSCPLKYLIASHFDHAYFIDPRVYTDFDIKSYVKDKDITDIMYLIYQGSMFYKTDYQFVIE